MIVVVDADVAVVLLILGDGIWAYLISFLMVLRWPFTVASEQGGYFRTCCNVILVNLVRYPASIDLANFWGVIKKI